MLVNTNTIVNISSGSKKWVKDVIRQVLFKTRVLIHFKCGLLVIVCPY